jgi:hypothetical protein
MPVASSALLLLLLLLLLPLLLLLLLLLFSYCIAIMADTEGSELHTGELQEAIKVEVGEVTPPWGGEVGLFSRRG